MKYKSSKEHIPYLTSADKERIARLDNDPAKADRKLKYGVSFSNPKYKCILYIICYGKDKDDLKQHIKEHLQHFTANDKDWKVEKIENLKEKDIAN